MYWSLGIYLSGKTKIMGGAAVILVPLTLILNFALIPRFGVYGAAWATFGAYLARFLWIYFFAQRQYLISYRWAEMARLYGILGILCALGFAYHPEPLFASIGLSTVLFLVSFPLIYTLVLSPAERATLKDLARGRIHLIRRAIGRAA